LPLSAEDIQASLALSGIEPQEAEILSVSNA
jgi:hypothetical protein